MDIQYYDFGFVFDIFILHWKTKCPVCSRWKRTTRVRFLYTGVLETFNGIVSLVEFTFERLLFARIYDYRRVNRGRAPKGTENQVSWIVQMTRDLELVQKVVKSHVRIKQILFFYNFFNFRNSNNSHFSYPLHSFWKIILFGGKQLYFNSLSYNLTISLLFNIKFYIQILKFNDKEQIIIKINNNCFI